MILDANDLPSGHELGTEICIVGGGAVGIAMALDLIGAGRDVLLLESGGNEAEADSQALYGARISD